MLTVSSLFWNTSWSFRPRTQHHRGYSCLSRITLMATRLHLWRQVALTEESGREFPRLLVGRISKGGRELAHDRRIPRVNRCGCHVC